MRIIGLEEHFVTPAFLEGPGKNFHQLALKSGGAAAAKTFDQLLDVGAGRLREMDAAGVAMQLLSLNFPGTEQSDPAEAMAIARDANDIAADAVRKHPDRFTALAALPTGAPEQAAGELERCVRQNGFKGAVINGHVRGRYLDDPFFSPILERAEALNTPIYLHPTLPPKAVIEASFGGFSPQVTFMLAGPGWGWHIETGVHVIRMILGGVFDRFPKLQIVIGHMGEGLSYILPRLDKTARPLVQPGAKAEAGGPPKLQRSPAEYLRQNVHYTFAAFNFPATFQNLLAEVGADRIMFSADYPYGSMSEAVAFLNQIPVSAAERDQIAHGNAERLFRL